MKYRKTTIQQISLLLILELVMLLATDALSLDWSPLIKIDNRQGQEKQNVRVAGPIGEYQESGKDQTFLFRPLLAWKSNDSIRYSLSILPPTFVVIEDDSHDYYRFLFAYYNQSRTENRFSTGFFPFFHYYKRGPGENTDMVLLPFYAILHQSFGYDRIFFVPPFYICTEKGNTCEQSILWPFAGRTTGDNLKAFRILPFFSYKKMNEHSLNYSVLWPFFSRFVSLDKDNAGSGWHLWPLFGMIQTKDTEEWTVVWPLFRYSHSTGVDSKKRTDVRVLWPFFQYSAETSDNPNSGFRKVFFWPFWGKAETRDTDHSFILWPFVQHQHTQKNGKRQEVLWIFPYMSLTVYDEKGNCTQTSQRVWPLCSFRQDHDCSDFQILDLLPLSKLPFIDKFINPLWTLFTYRKSLSGSSFECLWGLVSWNWNREFGDSFNLLSLYQLERKPELAQGHGSEAKSIRTIRRFLFGTVRQTVYDKGNSDLTLFWLVTF